MSSTTTTTPVIGATIFDADKPNGGTYRTVIADPTEAYVLDDGEFLIASYHGYITIGRMTGRTRRIFGDQCPTIERYEVETFATADGVIMGRKADRIPGISAVRSTNV
jgi:hypothetical protein